MYPLGKVLIKQVWSWLCKLTFDLGLTGSFKIRGVANQFARRPAAGHFVTMSAGNYGKSFAFASKHYKSKGKVVMPETAPVSRSVLIQVSLFLAKPSLTSTSSQSCTQKQCMLGTVMLWRQQLDCTHANKVLFRL